MSHETKTLKAMISSTARDLPDHRKEVLEACQRQGFFASRMEDLPAYGATAKAASLKMVDEADIYIGVFAHRYGYIPDEDNPERISVTEMEYNQAVEMKKPRLIFVMDPTHPITIDQVEQGDGAAKLKTFLGKVTTENIVRFYKSPADLRAEAINSLAEHLKEAARLAASHSTGSPKSASSELHYISAIPVPPEIYVAHPYSLLQTKDLIGRQDELNLLTDWVAKPDAEVFGAHILSITAIGGMGKSALTWKWFNDIAPEKMKPLAGRMWWSFFELEASFENFIIRALAYVTGQTIEEARKLTPPDLESGLLLALNRQPYLIVLDGLERLLIAYDRGDSARLKDSEVGSSKSLRKTADPRVGHFLRKLAQIKCSRILLSTRLFPAELETDGGDPLPVVFNRELDGLNDSDAVDLWRAFGVTGTSDALRSIFDSIERHALLIQALAGEVKRFKSAPGDFAAWRNANPQFNPKAFPRVQDAMAHVLEYARQNLEEKPWRVLEVIAAFRMPTSYSTLVAVLTEDGNPCRDAAELSAALDELEDRGLVGWDKVSRRYDLHALVRRMVWDAMDAEARRQVYTRLQTYLAALPMIDDYLKVKNLEDLTPAIELYHVLIGLERYQDAVKLFAKQLDHATLYRLSASRQRVELLEAFFSDETDKLPQLGDPGWQGYLLSTLAQGYQYSGQPGRAVPLFRRASSIYLETGKDTDLGVSLANLSSNLRSIGVSREVESAVRQALVIDRKLKDRLKEAYSLCLLGPALAARGEAADSARCLRRSLNIRVKLSNRGGEGVVCTFLAQRGIWFGEFEIARAHANRAWEIADSRGHEKVTIRAARVQGETALGLGEFASAEDWLYRTLTRARAVNLVEEELSSLIALAELRRRQENTTAAREMIEEVWEYAERGPYQQLHADALNVLAQVERDAGNTAAAIAAATKAYRLGWRDGPPYAYHWGLIKAQKHLEELGAPLPEMPPFDESKFEPMPEIEIDPDDEFHVGDKGLDELSSN